MILIIMMILIMVSLVLFIEFLSFQHFRNPNKMYCVVVMPRECHHLVRTCPAVVLVPLVPFFKPLCTVHRLVFECC